MYVLDISSQKGSVVITDAEPKSDETLLFPEVYEVYNKEYRKYIKATWYMYNKISYVHGTTNATSWLVCTTPTFTDLPHSCYWSTISSELINIQPSRIVCIS